MTQIPTFTMTPVIELVLGMIFEVFGDGIFEPLVERRAKKKAAKRTRAVLSGRPVKFEGGIKHVNSRYGWQPLVVKLDGDNGHFSCALFAVHITRQEPSFLILDGALRDHYGLTRDSLQIARFERPGVPTLFGLHERDWATFEAWLEGIK